MPSEARIGFQTAFYPASPLCRKNRNTFPHTRRHAKHRPKAADARRDTAAGRVSAEKEQQSERFVKLDKRPVFLVFVKHIVAPRFAVRQRQARRDAFEMQCPVPKAQGCVRFFIPAPFPFKTAEEAGFFIMPFRHAEAEQRRQAARCRPIPAPRQSAGRNG